MIVAFLACAKSGHPYCPIDISNPKERTLSIIDKVRPEVILTTEYLDFKHPKTLSLSEIKSICVSSNGSKQIDYTINDEDVFYILFTSGSTGEPKGVQITAKCVDEFLKWTERMVKGYLEIPSDFLNQAPFSFDLSVMDLYTCLYMGGTLNMLDKNIQMDFKQLLSVLGNSNAMIWVSTPSFANMCLADRAFSCELLPRLRLFLFCGEILANKTALELMKRFPKAKIINTYGPTEATVAVTGVEITRKMAEAVEALPIGKPNASTNIKIWKDNGNLARTNEEGEIVIIGDTVGKGYFDQPELTAKVFFAAENERGSCRGYRTGDKGFFDDSGMLHYCGRIDTQIKLNGYRIELEDIEKNLLKLDLVLHAAVVPKWQNDKVKSLTAFVVTKEEREVLTDRTELSKYIKNKLKERIPEYMIPKKIIRTETLPLSNNGKIDRKKLGELV